ncbi:hypothetical protein BXT86_06415 [candidate division WOR-3 bacterium 4484_100]|uniref:DUF4321 domain-containing protein n=1 Tax=candidate division WOR-3 bacterium 4484_100 TaxID=1936077 RepID=A0A1V4QDL7_UNCW3|nr:MAG: hypothetical protein BXT86_06415 [candidate division WOR-3 bacterium 4484_100]
MAKRRLKTIILGVILGGIIGSALSFFLAGLFPRGPVKNLLFSALKVGFSTAKVNLGFFTFSIGLSINITLITIIFIFLVMYLLHKV